jgi:hypothetical protein
LVSFYFSFLAVAITRNLQLLTQINSNRSKKNQLQTPPSKPFQPRETLYTWVDRLNIRQTPALSGEVVANVAKNVGLEFTGEQAEKLETIVLRGVAYQDTWLKVITPDGKEGWVFGGAVRREGEPKGNGPITDTEFDFPIFGKYDLSEWKKTGERREGEEVDYDDHDLPEKWPHFGNYHQQSG